MANVPFSTWIGGLPAAISGIGDKCVLKYQSGKFVPTTSVVVDSSDNVGIGTTSPGALLHVGSTTGAHVAKFAGGSDASSTAVVEIGVPIATEQYIIDAGEGSRGGGLHIYEDGSGKVRVSIATRASSTVTKRLTVLQTGSVGIGNTEPSGKLAVSPTIASMPTGAIDAIADFGSEIVVIQADNADLDTKTGYWGRWLATGIAAGMTLGRYGTNWGTYVAFHTHPDNTSAFDDSPERVRITGAGSVGIGTTGPANRLHLAGTDSSMAGPHICFTTAADAYPLLQVLPWVHDNVNILFDSYLDGGVWKSSDAGSNYRITKGSDCLSFFRSTGVAQGGTISSWRAPLTIDASGNVIIGQPSSLTTALTLCNSGSAYSTSFQAGVNITASRTYTLPTDFPSTNNYVLASSTAGVMSWVDSATIGGSLWSRTGSTTYMTNTGDMCAIGQTTTAVTGLIVKNSAALASSAVYSTGEAARFWAYSDNQSYLHVQVSDIAVGNAYLGITWIQSGASSYTSNLFLSPSLVAGGGTTGVLRVLGNDLTTIQVYNTISGWHSPYTSTNGSSLNLKGGDGRGGTSDGGDLNLTSGSAPNTSGCVPGNVNITTASGYLTSTPSGSINIGPGVDSVYGGPVYIYTGENALGQVMGGDIHIETRCYRSSTSSVAAGDIHIETMGAADPALHRVTPGNIIIVTGDGGNFQVPGATNGGDVTITLGAGVGNYADCRGGDFTLTAGYADTNQGRGGNVVITGGICHNSTAGAVTITGGATATSGAGGAASLTGGVGGPGGAVSAIGGAGRVSGNGGGSATLQGGAGYALSGAGAGGTVYVTGGAASPTGAGGSVDITSGAGGSTSGNSGHVTLNPGSVVAGTVGNVQVCTLRGSFVVGASAQFKVVGSSGDTTVGTSGQFKVQGSDGDIIKIKNLTYAWPTAHVDGGLLTNDGSGTLIWKRNQTRVFDTAASGTVTIDSDSYDMSTTRGASGTVTFAAPTGTPVQGQRLTIRIKDNGSARTISWNGVFSAYGTALPVATTAGKTTYVEFIYNSTDVSWDCMDISTET